MTLFLTGFEALTCSPTSGISVSDSTSLTSYLAIGSEVPSGPGNRVPRDLLLQLYPQLEDSFRNVGTLNDLNDYIASNFSRVVPGGFFAGDIPTFAWRGNYNVSFAVATQNLLDVSLLQTPIATAYQPFDYPFSPSAGKSLQFILYFGLAMSAYPAFFALYTNVERLRNVVRKAMNERAYTINLLTFLPAVLARSSL